jgi:hypothetical protein
LSFLPKGANEYEMDFKKMYRATSIFRRNYSAIVAHEFRIKIGLGQAIRRSGNLATHDAMVR